MKEKYLKRKANRLSKNSVEKHGGARFLGTYKVEKSRNKDSYRSGKKNFRTGGGENKKPQKTVQKSDVSFRVRSGYRFIDSSGQEVPHCPHGPCILLGRQLPSGDIVDRNFVCAVYRGGECGFRCPVSEDGKIDTSACASAAKTVSQPSSKKIVYNKIWKSFKDLTAADERLYYCKACNDAESLAHYHELIGPLKKSDLRKPSRLFSFDEIDSCKAQFWYAEKTLNVLEDVRTANNFDGVLCVGTPSVFEFLRKSAERRKTIKSFLLDLDHRFASFYRSTCFAQYSMLVDYFYDTSGEKKLKNFFSSVEKLMVICDPPFGVILDPLLISLKNLRSRFEQMDSTGTKQFNVILTLPFFLGKFLRNINPPMEMADFAVCYENHRKFSRTNGSPVRFFTDIPLSQFPILLEDEYRFCDMCERYVAKLNRHCGLCGVCPSKTGKTYKHCELCNRCVKPTYKHCRKCSRCHLPGRCV